MTEEEIKKLAREEMLNTIKSKLDSSMIFIYVSALEKRIDKAIEYIKENAFSVFDKEDDLYKDMVFKESLLTILGDKE